MELLETERESFRKERQELLNRIAAPETRVVDPSPQPHQSVAPADQQELAFIGREVPDGISVGSLRSVDG